MYYLPSPILMVTIVLRAEFNSEAYLSIDKDLSIDEMVGA